MCEGGLGEGVYFCFWGVFQLKGESCLWVSDLSVRCLKVTEEELGATRAVVKEQEATERALTAEAEQTKVSLVSAEQDVEGLYAKVARQVKMEVDEGWPS